MHRGIAASRVLLVRGFTLRFISAVTNIALVALIVPSDLGFLAVVRGVLGTIQFASELGFQLVLIRRAAEPTTAELGALTGYRTVVLLGLLAIGILSPEARSVFGVLPPEAGPWMLATMAVLAVTSPIQSACKVLLERELQFTKLSLIEVSGVLLQNLGLVAFAATGMFRDGVFIVSMGLSVFYMAVLLWARPVRCFSLRLGGLRPLVVESFGFSTSTLLDVARQSLTPILVAKLFDLHVAGLWDFAIRTGQFLQLTLEAYRRAGVVVAGRLTHSPALLRQFSVSILREVVAITYPLTGLLYAAIPLVGFLIPKWAAGVEAADLYLLTFGIFGVFEATLWPVIVARHGPGPAIKHQLLWMLGTWSGCVALWLAGGGNIAIPGVIGVVLATVYLLRLASLDHVAGGYGRVVWKPAMVLAAAVILLWIGRRLEVPVPAAVVVASVIPAFALVVAVLRKWSGDDGIVADDNPDPQAGRAAGSGGGPAGRLTISVLVPTFHRIEQLSRCLDALASQRRPPDEIVVTVRDTDAETRRLLDKRQANDLRLRVLVVREPGVVVALRAGLDAIRSDVVAITDDDAVPRPDWLHRIEKHFEVDDRIGGVGGRDYIAHLGSQPETTSVGLLQWHGRVVGNHHRGTGPAREVDVLKGVNMSLRRSALSSRAFDDRLHGSGAQVHWELACSLALRSTGAKLIYDPEVAVDHYPAERVGEPQRGSFSAQALGEAVHNETLALLDYLPAPRRVVFLVWSVLVGTSASPGLLQGIRLLLTGGDHATARLLAAWSGRRQGWATWRHRQHATGIGTP